MNTLGKVDLGRVSRAAPRLRYGASICFVGSREIFSDVIIRALESEMPEVSIVRVFDLADVSAGIDADGRLETGTRLGTLIVDEDNVAGLTDFIEAHEVSLARMRLVIAYGGNELPKEVMRLFRSGEILEHQVSLLPMDINITTWMLTLRIIFSGGHYIPPSVSAELAISQAISRKLAEPGLDHVPLPDAVASLTPREWDVLQLLASGQQNKIIADRLQVSEHTAKLHTHRIMHKLGVSNRTAAAIWYHRHAERTPLQ